MSDSHTNAVAIVERTAIVEAMHPLVSAGMAILERNPSPETLDKLLALQREYEADQARKAFAVALVGLKRDLPASINKDKLVDFPSKGGRTTYRHATLANVMEQIDGPLAQHGFAVSWTPSTGAGGVSVVCRLSHAAGHVTEATLTAPRDDSGGKNAIQQIGSTVTYLQRYTVLALLGIATSDMPDADDAPADDPERVDSTRSLRAVAALKSLGRTRVEAEQFIGRTVSDWTVGDLAKLQAWAEGDGATQTTSAPPGNEGLAAVLAAIDSAISKAELAAIMPHLAKLEPKDKAKAIAKHKAKAEAIGVGNKSGKASSAEPPSDDDVPPVSAYDFGPPPFDHGEQQS